MHRCEELIETAKLGPDVPDAAVEVQGGPGQRNHAGTHLQFNVLQVWLQQVRHDGLHPGGDPVVFPQHVSELVVIGLQLVLLQHGHFGGLRNLDAAHPIQAPCLPHQLQDLPVEVHVVLAVLQVPHDERGLEAAPRLLHRRRPGAVPHNFELHQRFRHLVVGPGDAPRVPAAVEGLLVAMELLHKVPDALEQVPRPGDVAGDGRHVPRERRLVLALLVHVLDRVQLQAIVVEDERELGVQVGPQRAVHVLDRVHLQAIVVEDEKELGIQVGPEQSGRSAPSAGV